MEIKLSNGGTALVDDEDYAGIVVFKWRHNKYAQRTTQCNYERRTIYMQHQVLKIQPKQLGDKEVDHINRNPLDNRKENLRIITHAENMRNCLRSMYKLGVCFEARRNKWRAYLDRKGYARKFIGYFSTMEEALAAVVKAEND